MTDTRKGRRRTIDDNKEQSWVAWLSASTDITTQRLQSGAYSHPTAACSKTATSNYEHYYYWNYHSSSVIVLIWLFQDTLRASTRYKNRTYLGLHAVKSNARWQTTDEGRSRAGGASNGKCVIWRRGHDADDMAWLSPYRAIFDYAG